MKKLFFLIFFNTFVFSDIDWSDVTTSFTNTEDNWATFYAVTTYIEDLKTMANGGWQEAAKVVINPLRWFE